MPSLLSKKREGSKIVTITAYDYTSACLVDKAGVDVVLVGDSLGNVIQGEETTLPVTLEQMIYHTRCVSRGLKRALLVADLPFLSYQPSLEVAIESSGRLIKEGFAHAVKAEGGVSMFETISRLVELDIPVMGHVGLTPQSVHRMGGYRVQGRDGRTGTTSRERVIEDAKAVEKAGAFSIVLEGLPASLAREITLEISIPTIGIGAGPNCDGQVLVFHDCLGLTQGFKPKFVKQYANLAAVTEEAIKVYIKEVLNGTFPGEEHSFSE